MKSKNIFRSLVFAFVLFSIAITANCQTPKPKTEIKPKPKVIEVGQHFGGGVIAYIFQPIDPGYIPGQIHGFIASFNDLGTGIPWWNGNYITTGATSTVLGSGKINTEMIIASQGSPDGTNYAANLCLNYTGGGFADWYLPSLAELQILHKNRSLIGNFDETHSYWTSSESEEDSNAWNINFQEGHFHLNLKAYSITVRAIRNF